MAAVARRGRWQDDVILAVRKTATATSRLLHAMLRLRILEGVMFGIILVVPCLI